MISSIQKSLGLKTFVAVLCVGAGISAFFTVFPEDALFPVYNVLIFLYVLLIILFGVFVWQVLLPLKRVTREMESLMSGREYREIVHARQDEIAVLGRFFNSVTKTIGKASHEFQEVKRVGAELTQAAVVQKRLLPTGFPLVPGLDIVVKTKSASEVGGDNFDVLPKEKSTLFALGDATGHGFPAGLVMSMVNVLMHAAAEGTEDTKEILTLVNSCLTPKILPTMFMTLVMLRWEHETQKLFYTGCGHEHIVIYRARTGIVEAIKTGGIALGMVKNISKILKEREIPLEMHDTVVLFTDGITEARNAEGKMYALEGLKNALTQCGGLLTARAIFKGLSDDFTKFVGPGFAQDDDITLMVLKYNMKGVKQAGMALSVDTSGMRETETANFEW